MKTVSGHTIIVSAVIRLYLKEKSMLKTKSGAMLLFGWSFWLLPFAYGQGS